MIQTIMRNPAPVALVTIGLVWLIKVRFQQHADARKDEYLTQKMELAATLESYEGAVSNRFQETSEDIRELSQELASQPEMRVAHVRDRAQVQTRSQRQKDHFNRLVHEHPLVLGFVSLAVGAAVGLMLPMSWKKD